MIHEDFAVLQSDVLDSMVRYVTNIKGSDRINVRDNLSECESLNEYRKSFLMKDGPCDFMKGVLKTLNNNSDFFSVNELEAMNRTWNNQSMISFASFRKMKIKTFISW